MPNNLHFNVNQSITSGFCIPHYIHVCTHIVCMCNLLKSSDPKTFALLKAMHSRELSPKLMFRFGLWMPGTTPCCGALVCLHHLQTGNAGRVRQTLLAPTFFFKMREWMFHTWYFSMHILVVMKKENGSRIWMDEKYSMKDSVWSLIFQLHPPGWAKGRHLERQVKTSGKESLQTPIDKPKPPLFL